MPVSNSKPVPSDFATLVAGAPGLTLPGTPGDDTLNGGPDDDVINGFGGNDVLWGGSGGDDILRGGAGNDTLFGNDGNDMLYGGGGNDYLIGGDGDDYLNPGNNSNQGYDTIDAGTGEDIVDLTQMTPGEAYFELSHDNLNVLLSPNEPGIFAIIDGTNNLGFILKGDNGFYGTTEFININNALTVGEWGGMGIYGTDNDDTFYIDPGDTGWLQVNGGDGSDTFNIAESSGFVRLDYVNADHGVIANLALGLVSDDGFGDDYDFDYITGTGYVTEFRGSDFDDIISGSSHDERFILRAGNDVVNGRGGQDLVRYDRTGVDAVSVDLEAGTATGIWRGIAFSHTLRSIEDVRGSRDYDDTLLGSSGANVLDGRGGNDLLNGRAGHDTLIGGAGTDTLLGGADNDILHGGTGADVLNGGQGRDTASYEDASIRVRADLAVGTNNTGDAAGDTYIGIEHLLGSAFNDRLSGNNGKNRITGGEGNDRLEGRGGNDTLIGGTGDDILIGGNGRDTFVFDGGGDVIRDFNGDRIKLDDALWAEEELTIDEILAFATIFGSNTAFDFGGGNTLVLENYTDIAGLADDLIVI